MAYSIKINGKVQELDVDGNMPLLWALRDVLGGRAYPGRYRPASCGRCGEG